MTPSGDAAGYPVSVIEDKVVNTLYTGLPTAPSLRGVTRLCPARSGSVSSVDTNSVIGLMALLRLKELQVKVMSYPPECESGVNNGHWPLDSKSERINAKIGSIKHNF